MENTFDYLLFDYNFEYSELVGVLKREIRKYISECNLIDDNTRRIIIDDIGTNYIDKRFDSLLSVSIDDIVKMAYAKWRKENSNLVELWKEVVIRNASNSNKPHVVANEAVANFKKMFKVE